MHTVNLILLLAGALCFGIQAARGLSRANLGGHVDMVARGLLCWILVPLIATIRAG
jgi:hypothetical protein